MSQRFKFRLGLVLMALSPDPVAAFERLLEQSLVNADAQIVPRFNRPHDELRRARERRRGATS